MLDAFETHLTRLLQFNPEEATKLTKLLTRDKFVIEDGRISLPGHDILLADLVDHELSVDLSHLRVNIQRIRDAIASDPALAIGSSKELLEATCKAILAELGEAVPDGADVPSLVNAVLKKLNLLAKDVSSEKRGADSIRSILSSLARIVQNVAELRNLYGTGHGKGPSERGLAGRHARLCAGAASTLATFLMETAVQRRAT